MTTLGFIGNLMLGRDVNDALRHGTPTSLLGTTLSLLRETSAVFGSLECAITTRSTPWTLTPSERYFRADGAATDVLRAANVRCVSLTRHILGFGDDGLLDTLEQLDAAHIAHTGAGRNLPQAATPAMVRLPGLTAGVVALTGDQDAFAATPRAAGTHYLDFENAPPSAVGLAEVADSCRRRGADLVILSLHWGRKMATEPSPRFRAFAHAAIDAGFDLVHGHGSHLFHGIELHRDKPILYDTGDFLNDFPVDAALRNDWSFIFLADVEGTRIERLRLVPVRLQPSRVDLAIGVEAAAICRRMAERCKRFGTEVTAKNGALEIECSSVLV